MSSEAISSSRSATPISEHIRDILHGKEVGMKYTFENMDKMSLKQEPLDSPEFVRFCEIE